MVGEGGNGQFESGSHQGADVIDINRAKKRAEELKKTERQISEKHITSENNNVIDFPVPEKGDVVDLGAEAEVIDIRGSEKTEEAAEKKLKQEENEDSGELEELSEEEARHNTALKEGLLILSENFGQYFDLQGSEDLDFTNYVNTKLEEMKILEPLDKESAPIRMAVEKLQDVHKFLLDIRTELQAIPNEEGKESAAKMCWFECLQGLKGVLNTDESKPSAGEGEAKEPKLTLAERLEKFVAKVSKVLSWVKNKKKEEQEAPVEPMVEPPAETEVEADEDEDEAVSDDSAAVANIESENDAADDTQAVGTGSQAQIQTTAQAVKAEDFEDSALADIIALSIAFGAEEVDESVQGVATVRTNDERTKDIWLQMSDHGLFMCTPHKEFGTKFTMDVKVPVVLWAVDLFRGDGKEFFEKNRRFQDFSSNSLKEIEVRGSVPDWDGNKFYPEAIFLFRGAMKAYLKSEHHWKQYKNSEEYKRYEKEGNDATDQSLLTQASHESLAAA